MSAADFAIATDSVIETDLAIETVALTKRYGTTTAVDSVGIRVPTGTIYGFLGPNGCGKTTTIRMLLGLLRPSDGMARVFGQDPWRESARLGHDVGYLPGDVRLYPWLSARRALKLFGRIRGRDIRARGLELAESLGFDPDLTANRMSRGTRQKLGIVLAMAHSPRLLILDEPTTTLDPVVQARFESLLRDLRDRGHSIFLSSHTLGEVERLCDRVAVLRNGRVIADDSLETLRGRAPRRFSIRWRHAPEPGLDARLPAGIELAAQSGDAWSGSLHGSAAPLLEWLAGYGVAHVDDIDVSPPDLESVFQALYAR